MGIRSFLRGTWSYRRLVLLVLILLALAWFVFTNREPAQVIFPFGFQLAGPVGLIVLLSAAAGALVAVLVLSVYRRSR